MDIEIERLIKNRCIEEVDITQPCPYPVHYSPMFLKAKPGTTEKRPLVNLRVLNDVMPVKHFKIEGWNVLRDLLRPGDWMIKIDLKKAYFHVPCHPAFQDLLRITHRGRHFRHRVLPQGASVSPWLWTKIMKAPLAYLRRLGLRIICYMDDLLILGETRVIVERNRDSCLTTLQRLGLLISWDKCSLEPCHKLEFLGLLVDSTTMTFEVPPAKMSSIVRESRVLMGQRRSTPRKLAAFLGRTNFLSMAMSHTALFTRSLTRLKNKALMESQGQWDKPLELDYPALLDLQFWMQECKRWNGKPIHLQYDPETFHMTLETDASPTGWGAVLRTGDTVKETYGHWNAEERLQSSNWKELTGIKYAIQSLVPERAAVLIRSDNKTAVSYVHKEGGKFPHLNAIAREIWDHLLEHHIRIHVTHIAGVENVAADTLSRKKFSHQDWQLNPQVFQSHVVQQWGVPEIDLFATANNHQVPRYYSRYPDPHCEGVDAFEKDWRQHHLAYANPPFALLARVVAKIRREQASVLLVTPIWKSSPWFPDLVELSKGRMLLLPHQDDLYLPVSSGHIVPLGKPRWQSAIWKTC